MQPEGGYTVTREGMLKDIRLMKSLNVNAVRTCHYPDDPMWYDLCDREGIMVVCEANVESHGYGYGKGYRYGRYGDYGYGEEKSNNNTDD